MLAVVTRTPELSLAQDEAHSLAVGLAEVQKHYEFRALDPKYVALGMLAITVVQVYGGKMLAISARKDAEKRAKANGATDHGPVYQQPTQSVGDILGGFDFERAN